MKAILKTLDGAIQFQEVHEGQFRIRTIIMPRLTMKSSAEMPLYYRHRDYEYEGKIDGVPIYREVEED